VSSRPLRAGLIGGGMIAAVHRHAVLAAGGTVAGVLGSSPGRSSELARCWQTAAFDDLDGLLAAGVDVLHICSPNSTHRDYALAALGAGIHVVCEKPLALSGADAKLMADAAEAAGVVAAVPFGRWNALHGSYLQDWLLDPEASNWRVDPGAGGPSRAFADIGSHWCDLVEFVSGERFAEVSALTSIAIAQRPIASSHSFSQPAPDSAQQPVLTEDVAIAALITENGVPANVVVSQVAPGRRNRLWFELDGTEASAVFDQEDPERAWIGRSGAATILSRGSGDVSADQKRLSFLPGGHAQGYQDAFNAFVADVFRAVSGGATPEGLPTFADGLRAARITDAVIASAQARQWVQVGSEQRAGGTGS
jgi:predicted dehydrogenase